MTPEFSRAIRLDTLGSSPRTIEIGADEKERAALARRFGLVSIRHLSAEAELIRRGDTVHASGTLRAEVVQSCVATGLDVPAALDEPFEVEFRPHPRTTAEEEIELHGSELDVVFHDGGSVDIGEAVAETLSLALDPYPRAPQAGDALNEAGIVTEDQAEAQQKPRSPLAGLKDLIDKKGE